MFRAIAPWSSFIILLVLIGCAPAHPITAPSTPVVFQPAPTVTPTALVATPTVAPATSTPEPTVEMARPTSTLSAGPTVVAPFQVVRTEVGRLTTSLSLLNRPVAVTFADALHGWLIAGECSSFGSTECGIFATSDGGVTWVEQYRSASALDVVSALDSRTAWVTGSGCSGQTPSLVCHGFLLGTVDGGRTWDLRYDGGLDLGGLKFVDATNGWAIFEAGQPGQTGLRRTSDGGRTWASVPIPLGRVQSLSFVDATHGWVGGACLDPGGPNTLGGCTRAAVFTTADGGAHWARIFSSPPGTGDLGAWIDRVDRKTSWVITADTGQCSMGGCWGELYRTTDGGKTWTLLQAADHWSPGTNDGVSGGPGFPGGLRFASTTVGWIPIDAGAGPGQGGIARTTDGGVTWQRVGGGRQDWSISDVVPVSEHDVWAVGGPHLGGAFLLHSGDGGRNWLQVLPPSQPERTLTFVDAQQGIGIGWRSDPDAVFATTDGGRTWQPRGTLSSVQSDGVVALNFLDARTGWVALRSSESPQVASLILSTNDGGAHWQTLSQSPDRIVGLHFSTARDGIFVGQYFGLGGFFEETNVVQTTHDGGATWETMVPPSLQRFSLVGGVAFSDPRTIWFGTGSSDRSVEIVVSHDGGATWTAMGKWTGTLFGSIPIVDVSDQMIWLGSEHRVLRTDDAGATWTSFSLDPSIAVKQLVFIDANDGWLSAQDGRLFHTADGGSSWEEL